MSGAVSEPLPVEEWRELANCRGVDPDLFYPERGASGNEAKKVCRGCVVREECLEWALDNVEKFGIWGGLSERERLRIRRRRPMLARRCQWSECGGMFTPTNGRQTCCSPAHTAAAASARKLSSSRRVG